MFSLFTLLVLNSAQFKADKIPLPNPQNLIIQAQPIASETCQNSPLRNFDLFNIEGKQVNKLIYFQTKQLLKDAKANNLPLSLTSTFRPVPSKSSSIAKTVLVIRLPQKLVLQRLKSRVIHSTITEWP
jgi:hypothetical protein